MTICREALLRNSVDSLVGDVLSIHHKRPGRPKSGCQCHLQMYFKRYRTQQGVLMYAHLVFHEITHVKANKACSVKFPKPCFKIRVRQLFVHSIWTCQTLIKALCWLQHADSLHYPKTAQRLAGTPSMSKKNEHCSVWQQIFRVLILRIPNC